MTSDIPGCRRVHAASSRQGDLLDEETGLLLIRQGVRAGAERHGCSARTLLRWFRKEGVSARGYVARVRRHLALELLAKDLPVGTIARRLGFSSAQSLARFLRREFGVTASELRRRPPERPSGTSSHRDSVGDQNISRVGWLRLVERA